MSYIVNQVSWNNLPFTTGISPQLLDQIHDFVAVPSYTLSFPLPSPWGTLIEWIGYNAQYHNPVDIPFTLINNFSSPTTSPDNRYRWQIRFWANGIAQKANPGVFVSGTSDGGEVGPSKEFTRIKDNVNWKVAPVYGGYQNSVLLIPGVPFYTSNTLHSNSAPSYDIPITYAGSQIALFHLSHYPDGILGFTQTQINNLPAFNNFAWPAAISVPLGVSPVGAATVTYQNFFVFQQAKVIVKDSTSAIISNSFPTYNNKNASDVFILNSGDSYGGDVKYEWLIEKSVDGGNTWTAAVGGGTDYTLNSGVLNNKGTINLNFVAPGVAQPPILYKTTFRAVGYSTIATGNPERTNPFHNLSQGILGKGDSGPNETDWHAIIEIVESTTITVKNTIVTLPILLPRLSGTTNPINHIVSVTPTFVANGDTEMKVETLLDRTLALKQEILKIYTVSGNVATLVSGPTTTTIIPSNSVILESNDPNNLPWATELLARCTVKVQLRLLSVPQDNNNQQVEMAPVVVSERTGLGPHTFLIADPGTYDIKVLIAPKVIITYSNTSTYTDNSLTL